jgi:hypothetical protein
VKAAPRDLALWVAVWLAIAAGAAVLVHLASAIPEPMERSELDRTLRRLRSDAGEARTLALAVAAGQLTANYAAQSHRLLSDDLRDVRQALDKPPPRDGAEDVQRARRAIEQLDALLKSVPASMADAETMRRIAEDEGAIAKALPAATP